MGQAKKHDRDQVDQQAREHLHQLLRAWFPGARVEGKKVYSGDGWVVDIGYGTWTGPNGETGTSLTFLRSKQLGISLSQAVNLVWAELKSMKLWDDQGSADDPSKPKPIIPVPDDAEKLNWDILMGNEIAWRKVKAPSVPTHRWEYRSSRGELLGYNLRFDPPSGSKIFQRLLWFGPGQGWKLTTDFPKPYPLYGLEELQRRQDAPVLVVEGEKTCDKARSIFPGYVVVTWPAGANSVGLAQWAWLKGRQTVLWPDADPEGRQAMEDLRQLLRRHGAKGRQVVSPPPDLPLGWDLADAPPPGVVPEDLLADALMVPREVVEMNERHAVVKEQGQVVVYTEEKDPTTGFSYYTRSSFTDIKNLYLNKQVVVAMTRKGPVLRDLGSHWLEHEDRREYQGVIFHPSASQPGYLNLWRGFAFEPSPAGSWSLLRQHLLENICRGVEAVFDYILDWLARMVQHPHEPGRVAVVMRGRRGTGKGVIAQAIGKLLGPHFLHISNSRHLLGHFNIHLRTCVCVYADEAFWAGDRQGESTLKTLITEDAIPLEGKGRDIVSGTNMLHLLIASNADWVVPAGLEERRFLVVDVSDAKIQDGAYFQKINDQLRDGGYESLLYDLLNRDISNFDVYDVPKTQALFEQKVRSMDPGIAWWLGILQEGTLPGDVEGHGVAPYALLVDSFVSSVGKGSYNSKGASTKLGLDLKKWLHGVKWPPKAGRAQYHKLVGYNSDGSPRLTKEYGRLVAFPELKACRQAFERLTGQVMVWEDPDLTWQPESWGLRPLQSQEDIPF